MQSLNNSIFERESAKIPLHIPKTIQTCLLSVHNSPSQTVLIPDLEGYVTIGWPSSISDRS